MRNGYTVLLLIFGLFSGGSFSQKISLKEESLKTLRTLLDAQLSLQVTSVADSNYGALRCPYDQVLHTRAAEAVYPLAVAYKHLHDPKDLAAAIRLADWLIRQQGEEGAWKETPEEWTGTTTDQLLMMVLAYPILQDHFGYEIDMSLWGLELYARLTGDTKMHQAVAQSLQNHLYFVYPNGAIDGSWGIRSNKWTTYGSQTADGCQILFSLFSGEDSRYRTAGWRNLQYLRTMIRDGLIGYGPQYWDLFTLPPCIYPTCMRSKNLALTIEFGDQQAGEIPPLPSDRPGWVRYFPTVDVALVRTKNSMATISAYRYKELQKRSQSKYMHRPTGGSLSSLWIQGHGFLQISSQTEYHRWEPMHFPEMGKLLPLTPRIEFTNRNGYFTNLYEFDGRMTVEKNDPVRIAVAGELCDKDLLPGGVAYRWDHHFTDQGVEKTVHLRYHHGAPLVQIVEPMVRWPNMTFEQQDSKTIAIKTAEKVFTLEILEGDVAIVLGENENRYVWPFPSLRAFPITLKVMNPDGQSRVKIRYRIRFPD